MASRYPNPNLRHAIRSRACALYIQKRVSVNPKVWTALRKELDNLLALSVEMAQVPNTQAEVNAWAIFVDEIVGLNNQVTVNEEYWYKQQARANITYCHIE